MSEEHRSAWDVISLSLVLNFVPEPSDRGEKTFLSQRNSSMPLGRMLQLAHQMLAPGGYLFLAVRSLIAIRQMYLICCSFPCPAF